MPIKRQVVKKSGAIKVTKNPTVGLVKGGATLPKPRPMMKSCCR